VTPYGIAEDQIHVVHNWALQEMEATPSAIDNTFRKDAKYGDRFVITYSGNMGAAHSFETVLNAAVRLRDRTDILFVFIGDGVRRQAIVDRITREGLQNVQMRPYVPRETLPLSMGAAHAHLVTMRDQVDGLVMPSKLYGILAAARPVIFVGPEASEVTRIIETSGCGEAVRNGDTDGLVEAILRLANNRPATASAGEQGRQLLLQHYTRTHAITQYERVLMSVVRPLKKRSLERTEATADEETGSRRTH
jgi:colanic acid biosynthesis glycosyl transferase WcaI